MSQEKKPLGRRSFLMGVITGGGLVAAIAGLPRKVTAKRNVESREGESAEPVLYQRTAEAERYYRTLYYS